MKLDSVFDPARALRIPNTLNIKYIETEGAIETAAWRDEGEPIEAATMEELLAARGVMTLPDDNKLELSDVLAPETNWGFASSSCGYAMKTIKGWAGESPTGRHPWLLKNYTRLECMRRNGCLTRADYTKAATTLEGRFRSLLASGDSRAEKPGEISDVRAWAVDRASRKTRSELASELGSHEHGDVIMGDRKTTTTPKDSNVMGDDETVAESTGAAAEAEQPDEFEALVTERFERMRIDLEAPAQARGSGAPAAGYPRVAELGRPVNRTGRGDAVHH